MIACGPPAHFSGKPIAKQTPSRGCTLLQLTTLGRIDLRTADGTPIDALLSQPKRLALLVVLACEGRGTPVARERLIALLWPDLDDARARNALSQALFHLRQSLGSDAIENVGHAGLALRAGVLQLDLDAVAAPAMQAAATGTAPIPGPFCPGLAVAGSAAFDEWLAEWRARVEALGRAAIAPPTEAPLPPAGVPAPHAGRTGRRRRLALAGAAIIGVAVSAVAATRHSDDHPELPGTVVVLPFTSHGGSIAFLGEGMVDLLSAKLDSASGLRALDPSAVLPTVRRAEEATPERASAVARRFGAGWYIIGDVTGMAGRVQLSAALYAAGAKAPTSRASVAGDTTALFQLVDELTGRLLAGASPGRDPSITQLAAVTTHSLPALKSFLAGERALRRGEDSRAAAAFHEATQLDSTFALAWYRLSITSSWVRGPDSLSLLGGAEMASRYVDHLPAKARRLLEAFLAYRQLRGHDALRLYRAATRAYPDEVDAWMMFAESAYHFGPPLGHPPSDAIPPFRRLLELDPANPHALLHLARLAALSGQRATFDSLRATFASAHGDADRLRELDALRAGLDRDSAAIVAAIEATRGADDVVAFGVFDAILLGAQDLSAMPALARRFVGDPHDRSILSTLVRREVTAAHVLGGHWTSRSAEPHLRAALEERWLLEAEIATAVEPAFLAPPATLHELRHALASQRTYCPLGTGVSSCDTAAGSAMQRYLLALLDLRLGDTTGAATASRALASRPEPWGREMARALRAELARARGDLPTALAELEQFNVDIEAIRGTFHTWGVRERFARAEVLHALGRDREALALYDTFLHATDLPFIGMSHLRRGELRARLDERPAAAFHLERALALWARSDPSFRPLVEQARDGLARLRGDVALR